MEVLAVTEGGADRPPRLSGTCTAEPSYGPDANGKVGLNEITSIFDGSREARILEALDRRDGVGSGLVGLFDQLGRQTGRTSEFADERLQSIGQGGNRTDG